MKKMLLTALSILLLLLCACSVPEPQPGPTPSPASSPAQAAVATPPPASPSPTQAPTPSPDPTPAPTPMPYVKLSDPSSPLNVRSGPGTDTEKIGELHHGDSVEIIERGDVWHKIAFNGGEAYVFASYISGLPVLYATVPALEATVGGKTYISKMVDVRAVVPDIRIWLTFASQDNVMGKVLYPAGACLLQESTAQKLAAAAEIFAKDGFRIRLYDGYRPYSVSQYLWDEIRDGRFVAHPTPTSPSNHNRGAAVDITLEYIDTGNMMQTPSPMHTFNISSLRSLPDPREYEEGSDEYNAILAEYPDILKYTPRSSTGLKNMNYMTSVMKSVGFTTISSEWWHFNDKDKAQFMVLDYDLAADVTWVAAEDYEAFMAEQNAQPPLTDLPGYVIFPITEDSQ